MMKYDISLEKLVEALTKLVKTCEVTGYALKCAAAMADKETREYYERRQERRLEQLRERNNG